MSYYVYILQSEVNSSYYIGVSKDLLERLERHNRGGSTYTKRYKPWRLLYSEVYITKSDAYRRERQLKSYKGGDAFQDLLKNAGVV
ncbi:GIY-YIG nuclease family protein [Candidatus Gracilibacteria bacterium]|jgi:putative endonuclease|nr:GIY-YIG nuclease family protein [Candidatus Gracilibacteria bacterium]